jgi:fermentation-respiration switch protein FrsA (DUF1100 family)
VLGGDATAGVGDLDEDLPVLARRGERDLAAPGRVGERVLDQIADRTLEERTIKLGGHRAPPPSPA